MGQTPEDALQGYFDDLLLAPSCEPSPAEAVVIPPKPVRQEVVVKEFVKARPHADFEPQVERQTKEKVAKLLASAVPTVEEPIEVANPEMTAEPELVSAVEGDLDIEHQALKAKLEVIHEEVIDEAAITAQKLADERAQQHLTWCENGRPQWAQERFDVLLFSVSGLTLAVPLISLGQIQPLTEELTPLFGQADWFMGLQPTPMGKVRTINTAKFVMPERYDERFLETARYVISIDGVPWGLAVDEVKQPITLEPDDVKWRGERSKRAWLAGTVKEHMCALIDIPVMGQMLEQEDKNRIQVG